MKVVILIMIGFLALTMLTCGGGIAYIMANFENETENPEATFAMTERIVEVDIPDGFEPCCTLGMDAIVVSKARTHFRHTEGEGALVFSMMDNSLGDQQLAEEQLRQQSTREGAGEQFLVNKTEFREFEIRGVTTRFEFAEAEERETGTTFRAATGYFPSHQDGAVGVFFRVEEDYYDEDALVAMIESIR